MDVTARLMECLSSYSADIGRVRAWYESGFHHGTYCGPGAGSGDPIDDLDACCAQHDIGYGDVNLSADTAWDSPQDFIASRHADRALAMCAATAQLDAAGAGAHGDPETYRQRLIELFTLRADIGDALHYVQEAANGLLDRIRQLGEYLPSFSANALPAETHQWVESEIASLRAEGVHDHEMGLH